MRGISWLAENRLASEEGLCSMDWLSKITNTYPELKLSKIKQEKEAEEYVKFAGIGKRTDKIGSLS